VEERIKDRHLRPVNLEERGGAVGGGGGVVQQIYSKHIVLGEEEEKVFLKLARYLVCLAFLVLFSTRVQILTPEELRARTQRMENQDRCLLYCLFLLVHKYKY
jgi:hypothetical protein